MARKVATYEDVLDAPKHRVAEVIGGELRLFPRPSPRHARAAGRLYSDLEPPFDRGRDGPGGWVILFEPELHLGHEILVPDIGGCRTERLPSIPEDAAYFTLAPDWICEVLSPSTAKVDRVDKSSIYARERVGHLWLVDPMLRTLEVLELRDGTWHIVAVHSDDAPVRARPSMRSS